MTSVNPYGGGNANPGGPGGRRVRVRPAAQAGGRKPPKRGCCSMVEAGKAVGRGKYRLARRYAAMSVRTIAARII